MVEDEGRLSISGFEEFLRKSRKINGEKYLEKTIIKYCYYIDRYSKTIASCDGDVDSLISSFSIILKKNPHQNLRSAFKNYLYFLGVSPDDERLSSLKLDRKYASSLNSLRELSVKSLSEKELNLLFNSLDLKWSTIIGFFYDTACRESELLSVTWNDITVLDDGSNVKFATVSILGKGSKRRTVYLSKLVYDKLLQYRANYCLVSSDKDFVFQFYKNDGELYSSQAKYLIDNVKKLGYKVLGRNVTPHYLRHCVSEDTMALTENGWKRYFEIREGDKIFTLNLKNDSIELTPVDKILSYNVVDEEMVHINYRYADLLVTKDHKNIMKIDNERTKNKKKFTEWNDWELISFNDYCERVNKRQVSFRLSGLKREGKSIGLDKAKIIGWALSDGALACKGLVIHQSFSANPEKCEIIRQTLKSSGLKFSENTYCYDNISVMKQFRIFTEDIKWIFKYIDSKRMPKWSILQLPYEELNAIYEMMMLGDGSRSEYTVQNEELIDFFRILVTLIGKRTLLSEGKHNITNLPKKRTYVSSINFFDFKDRHWSIKKYTGVVWCPNTVNGTFIVKRNNTICLTGNSKLTHLADQGADVYGIAKYAGHADISTCQIYIKHSSHAGENAFERHSRIIGGGGS